MTIILVENDVKTYSSKHHVENRPNIFFVETHRIFKWNVLLWTIVTLAVISLWCWPTTSPSLKLRIWNLWYFWLTFYLLYWHFLNLQLCLTQVLESSRKNTISFDLFFLENHKVLLIFTWRPILTCGAKQPLKTEVDKKYSLVTVRVLHQ